MKLLKKILCSFTPQRLKDLYLQQYIETNKKNLEFASLSYSQEGEDLLLNRLFDNKPTGFFVDVGAHHPKRFSNTYFFYKKGWTGINIDPMPGVMNLFNVIRPKDINLELGINNNKEKLLYYIFNEPALNTFSESEALKKDGLRDYRIIDKIEIDVFILSEILDKYLPNDAEIDFMTIDVEGLDLNVLKSNNWEKYLPKYILIESLRSQSIKDVLKTEIDNYLSNRKYVLCSKLYNTLIYKKNDIS